jgi:hypothetical protein
MVYDQVSRKREEVSVDRLGGASADQGGWHSVLAGPAPLADVVIVGSGKDADILITLADGRELSMGADDVTVSADSSVQARITRLDDVNIQIRYCGPGLVARSVRVKYDSRDPEWQDEFLQRLRAWLAGDSSGELNFCVDADIVLTAEGQ